MASISIPKKDEKKGRTELCGVCNREMAISEGSVIYDTKWYHNSCWDSVSQNLVKV